ncbi:alkylation response protein AidB-like acyl-CoA dehydrogenase [Nocardioides cavernae]|uniref:Dibenzothiophene monooxygenase n=1 Tax=Nocardioides cavernae TaxID=1921566 RepID=A0A7Y9H0A4_9ACTN|nr:acyl-CoA dehydrogenase family protein [Nocardioides cavernae]NYE35573.1 alkylation response protein AidB-like acyl-CoA dehydrogenase [Nocardioides cavernae]
MTTLRVRPTRSRNDSATDHPRTDWADVLASIAEGALQREVDGELPVEAVRLLKSEGFGALRVPRAYGGAGVGLADLARLWIDLAAVDANLPQAFRGHFALVEDRLWHHARGSEQRVWFDRFVAGEIAGNAWSEVGSDIDLPRTVLRPRADGSYRLDGTKYYTTGTIFAEWTDVHARLALPGHPDEVEDPTAIALVDTRDAGVVTTDDWNGFGQKGTGSGTTTFDNVSVPAEHVLPFEERFPYQTAFYQLNLLATLTGIAKAALTDVVEAVQKRTRNFSHANAPRVRDDAQVLARVGEVAAAVYAAEAATLRVAESVQAVADAVLAGPEEVAALVESSEIESSTAQVVVSELVLRATSDIFDVLGASATARPQALDRHWRNARTVASHNPRILKARVVGAHAVNGTPPPYAWSIGGTRRRQDWVGSRPAPTS